MAKRLTGNTATHFESAWSGIIISIRDDEAVLAQAFYPKGEGTHYDTPKLKPILYDETDSAGFMYNRHFYHLADFMRDNFPN